MNVIVSGRVLVVTDWFTQTLVSPVDRATWLAVLLGLSPLFPVGGAVKPGINKGSHERQHRQPAVCDHD